MMEFKISRLLKSKHGFKLADIIVGNQPIGLVVGAPRGGYDVSLLESAPGGPWEITGLESMRDVKAAIASRFTAVAVRQITKRRDRASL